MEQMETSRGVWLRGNCNQEKVFDEYVKEE